ncbi:MAG: hypothetical protein IPK72_17785 [Candidatus Eisenbacteria bacterium]|nr:hypothetical protein [Candidatus Eisenbacteria bacterium]
MTDRHHRAVAKVAFNYLMYFSLLGMSGDEGSFSAVRDFIRCGKRDPEDFVKIVRGDVLADAGAGRNTREYGHLVGVLIGSPVVARVQFCAGRELGGWHFAVRLGDYPLRVAMPPESRGHFFRITSEPSDRADAGEVIELDSITRIIPATWARPPR